MINVACKWPAWPASGQIGAKVARFSSGPNALHLAVRRRIESRGPHECKAVGMGKTSGRRVNKCATLNLQPLSPCRATVCRETIRGRRLGAGVRQEAVFRARL